MKETEEKGKIEAIKAEGEKCTRCWHYSVYVNMFPKWPGICGKCVYNLEDDWDPPVWNGKKWLEPTRIV